MMSINDGCYKVAFGSTTTHDAAAMVQANCRLKVLTHPCCFFREKVVLTTAASWNMQSSSHTHLVDGDGHVD